MQASSVTNTPQSSHSSLGKARSSERSRAPCGAGDYDLTNEVIVEDQPRSDIAAAMVYYEKLEADLIERKNAVSTVVWAEHAFWLPPERQHSDCRRRLEFVQIELYHADHALEILGQAEKQLGAPPVRPLQTNEIPTTTRSSQSPGEIDIEALQTLKPHVDADRILYIIDNLKGTVHTYLEEVEKARKMKMGSGLAITGTGNGRGNGRGRRNGRGRGKGRGKGKGKGKEPDTTCNEHNKIAGISERKWPKIEKELQNLGRILKELRQMSMVVKFAEGPELFSQQFANKPSGESANGTEKIPA